MKFVRIAERAIRGCRVATLFSEGERGFVLPVVVFGLVVMSILAVAAVVMSGDEHRAARAMRESSAAFYAAEAGIQEIWGFWDDTLVSGLSPGGSVDLGLKDIGYGSSYRAIIYRVDDASTQPMYAMTVEGRGGGLQGGQRMLSLTVTADTVTDGAVGLPPWARMGGITGRGRLDVRSGSVIDGNDALPPTWSIDPECPIDLADSPGVFWEDANDVLTGGSPPGEIKGEPPIVEDPSLSDPDFYNNFFNGSTWDDLVASADYDETINGNFQGAPRVTNQSGLWGGTGACLEGDIGTYNGDPWLNLGSYTPGHPCYDYFPITHLDGDAQMSAGFGQGVLIVDGDLDMLSGTEFYGVVMVRGCLDMEGGAKIFGAVLIDGTASCPGAEAFPGLQLLNNSRIQWSRCGVRRALEGAGLSWASAGGWELLDARSFSDMSF